MQRKEPNTDCFAFNRSKVNECDCLSKTFCRFEKCNFYGPRKEKVVEKSAENSNFQY